MRIASLLFLLVLVTPASAEPFVPGQALDQRLVAQVASAAFAFMAPRTLDPVPAGRLALWGLRGLATLDSQLAVDRYDATLRLTAGGRVMLVRASPESDDFAGWGQAVAEFIRAGWNVSESVRRAGTGGVIRSFFDEMFNHLDPYSRYASPAEAAAERLRRAGRAGIGIQVGRSGRGFAVRSVVVDGPASQAGIRSGEHIVAIDEQSTAGIDLDVVHALLAGPEGSRVTLTLRAANGRIRRVEMLRALVPPETVLPTRLRDLLVLRITGFASDTAQRLAQEIARGLARPHPPRGLVLDLRGNRGGLLRQAAQAAGTLIPHGVVAMTAGRDPAAAHTFLAEGTDLAKGLPVVVMVDGRTASAAEILAAALADDSRAVVVGSSTFGKGLVQTIAPLPDGGELLVTWSRVLAPRGWPIQGLGVLPQVCTSLGVALLQRQLADLSDGRSLLAGSLSRQRSARAPVATAEVLDIRKACPAAEGRDADLAAARRLIEAPSAYAAALLPRQ